MKKCIWIAAMALCLLAGIGIGSVLEKGQGTGDTGLPDELRCTKNGSDDVYRKHSETEVSKMEFSDSSGNRIVYYVCQTTYFFGRPADMEGVDAAAISGIVNLEWGGNSQSCQVNGQEAILLTKKDYSYLCWTLSPEYSFVISYNPEAVAEEDIFKMAESVRRREE